MAEPFQSGQVMEEKIDSIDEVFQVLGLENLLLQNDKQQSSKNIEVDGFLVHPISLRYMTFYQKGLVCPCCGRVGTYFRLCGDPNTQRRHFNLFAEDGMLMTKDHIIPRSKGGKNEVSNLQTMCESCNKAKGSYFPGLEIQYLVATNCQTGKKMYFRGMEQAVQTMIENHIKPKKQRSKIIQAVVGAVLKIQSALENKQAYCGYTWTYEMK